jgi:uncharacterized protein (DUF924 family)
VTASRHNPDAVLDFWFGDARRRPEAISGRMGFWFSPDEDADREVSEHFRPLLEPASRGHLTDWLADGPCRLALILIFDQAPRVIHRRRAEAFAYDGHALSITLAGLDAGHDRGLSLAERAFFYMPLQHSEDPAVQRISLRCYERLTQDFTEQRELAQGFLSHARQHADVIARFGRYPHRNAVLERDSTDAERAFLEDGPRFGQ